MALLWPGGHRKRDIATNEFRIDTRISIRIDYIFEYTSVSKFRIDTRISIRIDYIFEYTSVSKFRIDTRISIRIDYIFEYTSVSKFRVDIETTILVDLRSRYELFSCSEAEPLNAGSLALHESNILEWSFFPAHS
jgi:hypothetical protein